MFCPGHQVIFKMDFAGNGVLVERSQLNKAMDLKADMYTFEKFRYMCILSGCDYLSNLPGIGLGKASKLFKLTRQTDMKTVRSFSKSPPPQEVMDCYCESFIFK